MPEEESSNSLGTGTPYFLDFSEDRKQPGFFDLVRPQNVFLWGYSFLESWFLSRNYRLLWVSLPVLAIGIGGGAFLLWLRGAPRDDVVKQYEAAVATSIQEGDTEKSSLYLESLVRLRPGDNRYRFQLALHLLDVGQVSRAVAHLEALTSDEVNAYIHARLWLISQATSEQPVLPMSAHQIEAQAMLVLKEEARNVSAKRVLAALLVNKGQFKAAEEHLLDLVDDYPEFSIPLVRLQKQLKRSGSQIDNYLSLASSFFGDRLMQNPADFQSRISVAETFVLKDQPADAERVLKEGLAVENGQELRSALAQLYGNLALTRIRGSLWNKDSCAKLIVEAIRLNPTNFGLLQQAVALDAVGASFSPDELLPAIDALRAVDPLSVELRVLLSQSLSCVGESDEAIWQIESLASADRRLRILQVRLLKSAGRNIAAREVADKVLAEVQQEQASDQGKAETLLEDAELLVLTSRFPAAMHVLENIRDEKFVLSDQEQSRWDSQYGRVCVALYDRKLAADNFRNSAEPFKLLNAALLTNAVSTHVLERYVSLSCSENSLADAANQEVNRLLAVGTVNSEIYNLIGSIALQANDVTKARRYLKRAYGLTRTNPIVLNNLALALVRGNGGDTERALQLTDDALTMLPDNAEVLSTRAEVYIAMERWEDARRDLEVSLPERLKNKNHRELLVKVCVALEEPDLAAEHRRILQQLQGQ